VYLPLGQGVQEEGYSTLNIFNSEHIVHSRHHLP